MNVTVEGGMNLAGFVRATAGRKGSIADIRGGVAVAGPFGVPNAYVNTAVPTDPTVSAVDFFDDAVQFFNELGRMFVLWAPMSDPSLAQEAARRNFVRDKEPSPAMVSFAPTTGESDLQFRLVNDEDSASLFGDVCERGYGAPGMATLLSFQESYLAADSYWHLAFDGDVPVSAACGFLNGTTGGIYSVATPAEFRGRGFAAAVTAVATNHLFAIGASKVVLQSSKLGFGVYERLGFTIYDHYERFTIPLSSS